MCLFVCVSRPGLPIVSCADHVQDVMAECPLGYITAVLIKAIALMVFANKPHYPVPVEVLK